MRLDTAEFIRRFLIHVLPSGFHRIRHYGLLSDNTRTDSLPLARKLLQVPPVLEEQDEPAFTEPVFVCRRCGEPMIITEVFERAYAARGPPIPAMSGSEFNNLSVDLVSIDALLMCSDPVHAIWRCKQACFMTVQGQITIRSACIIQLLAIPAILNATHRPNNLYNPHRPRHTAGS